MAETIETENTVAPDAALSQSGGSLGWLGVVPFVVLSAWLYAIAPDHPWREGTIDLLVIYGAIFLSFLGGIRWGMAMVVKGPGAPMDIVISIVPMLAAWASFAMKTPYTFAALAVVFAAAGAWDALAVGERGAPAWYGRLRARQTAVIVATLVLAFAATG